MYCLAPDTDALEFIDGSRRLRIAFATESIARITVTDSQPFRITPSHIITHRTVYTRIELHENPREFTVSTSRLRIVLDKRTGALAYFDAQGKLLVREPDRGGKWLTRKEVHKNVYASNAAVSAGQSIDGARASSTDFQRVFDRHAFEAKLELVFSENEALFGLGSHEEGFGNLRGKSRELYQQNMKAVVPHLVSTRGYGLLLDCGSLMTFHDDARGSYLWADVVDELDFYVIHGATHDDIIRGYHTLTGRPPLLPKWAFGYTQSKERYVNAREMLDVVKEYRRRKIPLDLIVLDWKSWPDGGGWGQKTFDPVRFADPRALTDELHQLGARMMISIWPIMTGDCPNQRELADRGLMLGNRSTYDAFSEEARRLYWEQASRGLFAHGIDAWWCDCTEPFEADWEGAVKPEPHHRLGINVGRAKQYLDSGYLNIYSLLHSQGIYEGQRRTTDRKRVVNLTRSSYAGQHRYATITWSGDISATWETLRRSIPEGLNFCATGEPYWTVDIGGFFVKNDPTLWFWRGDYDAGCRGLTSQTATEPDPADTGCTDLGYHELYVRWLQYAAFLPMFRSHGTDASREIWRFGEPGNPFYDALAKFIRLRSQLIPWFYSLAARITFDGASFMRPLALEFPDDTATHTIDDQFIVGSSLLVCPVIHPMYYARESRPLENIAKSRPVYLPADTLWYDFWTEKLHTGGHHHEASAPLDTLPLFVRAGTILPLGPVLQHVNERHDFPYELRIYSGASGSFCLYEDAGDTYDYEQGACAEVVITWNDTTRTLTFAARQGTFPELIETREFQIALINPHGRETRTTHYTGTSLKVSF